MFAWLLFALFVYPARLDVTRHPRILERGPLKPPKRPAAFNFPLPLFSRPPIIPAARACLLTLMQLLRPKMATSCRSPGKPIAPKTPARPRRKWPRGLNQHNFKVTWGENGSLDMLRGNLARGVPTLVEWIDWGGHWVIVVGYDTRQTPRLSTMTC